MGLPADANWPTLWADKRGYTIGAVLLCVGFQVLAVYFLLLVRRVLREAPPTRRDAIRPLCTFGVAFGFGSGLVFTVATFAPRVLPLHAVAGIIGAFALILTSGLGVSMARQNLLSARFVDRLPDSQTPESVARYLKEVLKDESVELLYVDPESAGLIDADGRHRPVEPELETHRFRSWVWGSDGSRIGLLTGQPLLENDKAALGSLRRIVTILAENARLQAVLRMRVAQLTATRAAQQFAFEQAREEFHRDLHDGVQQTIAAALLDLEGLAEADLPEKREQAIALLDAKLRIALEEVHSLKQGVRPPALQCGLTRAIDRVVAELRLVARIRITDADLGALTLPVYYLIREALTNVHKHAHAGMVEIDVATDGRTIDVEVRDDGVGGAADRGHGGIGGMRQRTVELGGHFTINSSAGVGTTVRVSVPCASS
jgi:signal transduction histidine kinase